MKIILSAAALVLPLVAAGYAAADEPLRLTDDQMDGVSAGVIADAGALAASIALGGTPLSQSATSAVVQVIAIDPVSGLQYATSTSNAAALAAN